MIEEMDKIRRIVTGHKKGKSIIVSDSGISKTDLGAGKEFYSIWGDDSLDLTAGAEKMGENLDWFPGYGGYRFFIWKVPPKASKLGNQKSKAEIDKLVPGFLSHFEHENPGMHTSETIDCTYLIEGEITLEVDDNEMIELQAGDSIVQNATRHRWHNYSDNTAVLITTSLGVNKIDELSP